MPTVLACLYPALGSRWYLSAGVDSPGSSITTNAVGSWHRWGHLCRANMVRGAASDFTCFLTLDIIAGLKIFWYRAVATNAIKGHDAASQRSPNPLDTWLSGKPAVLTGSMRRILQHTMLERTPRSSMNIRMSTFHCSADQT